jgi:hypothetical protein
VDQWPDERAWRWTGWATHRCHILETGNDSFRFKASSAAAIQKKKEAPATLTPT